MVLLTCIDCLSICLDQVWHVCCCWILHCYLGRVVKSSCPATLLGRRVAPSHATATYGFIPLHGIMILHHILLQQEDQLVTGVVHGMQADRNLDSEEGEACSGQKAHVLEALQSEMNSVTVRHVS